MTPRAIIRLTQTVYVVAILYVVAIVGLTVSRAAEPIEIRDGKLPPSLSVGQVVAEIGLNGSKYAACKGDIFRLFEGNLDAKLAAVGVALIEDALRAYKDQMAAYLVCRAESFLNNLCVYGNCKGGGVDCKKPVASDVTSFIKLNYKNRLKSAFLSSCTALYALKFTGDTVDGMIQSQGPGGAPAAAQDWIADSRVAPAEMAQRRTWSLLVNTDICPYFREEALDFFGVPQSYRDSPPIINSMQFRVDERPPFSVRAGCTLEDAFDPSDTSMEGFLSRGGYAGLTDFNEPQNQYWSFIAMAQEELDAQTAAMVESTQEQLVAGGGFLPIYGDEEGSCQKDPEGRCIDYGRIKQPPGAVRDIRDSDIDNTYAALNKADGENAIAMTDLGARLQARLLDLSSKPLPLILELAAEDTADNFTPVPTPTPTSDPNDPACTGGNPDCTCVKDDPSAQQIARTVISEAMAQAMQQNPELFVPGTNQIAPGADFTLVQHAICDRISISVCVPHPGQSDEIVIRGGDGLTISFDVITSDGFLRTNGGQPIAQCIAGVQD